MNWRHQNKGFQLDMLLLKKECFVDIGRDKKVYTFETLHRVRKIIINYTGNE